MIVRSVRNRRSGPGVKSLEIGRLWLPASAGRLPPALNFRPKPEATQVVILRVMKGLLVALVAVQAAACAARITPPKASVQASALTRWDAAAFSGDSFDPRWWRQLEDPVLDELENAALAANHDIRSALARLDQSRAVFDEERRRRYPTATANAFVDVREQGQPGFSDQPARVTTYRVGLDASWELDFFGRVRSAIAAIRQATKPG